MLIIRLSKNARYYQVRLKWRTSLPQSISTPFNPLFRQWAELSLLRPRFTLHGSKGILTLSSIDFTIRLNLRSRLTLIRLALIRKPQSCGEGVSHPLYRYLYLHLLFQTLQHTLRYTFNVDWNAPLPICKNISHSFGRQFIPDYYPRPTARLVSCYALFK